MTKAAETIETDVAKIAAGLTEAQREALRFKGLSIREDICRSPSIATARALYRKGIIERPSYVVPFTLLGQQVAHLLRQGDA